jgi:hypothetical protein
MFLCVYSSVYMIRINLIFYGALAVDNVRYVKKYQNWIPDLIYFIGISVYQIATSQRNSMKGSLHSVQIQIHDLLIFSDVFS